MQLDEAALQGLLAQLDSMRLLPRSPRLDEIVSTAVFLASDQAAAITGSFVNATGMFVS
jgi:enoyl-[acyl-carrier-protein] reductase (NADH)